MMDEEEKLNRIVDALEPGAETDEELAQLVQADDSLSMLRDAECLRQAAIRKGIEESLSKADVEKEYASFMQRMEQKPKKKSRIVPLYRNWLIAGAAACLLFIIGIAYWARTVDQQPQIASNKTEKHVVLPNSAVHRRNTNSAPTPPAVDSTPNVPQRLLSALGLAPEEVATESHTISTKSGKTADLVLPDGTKVWLYADSKITYPKAFSGKERTVYLQGQAEFDVTHDPDHPFVVMTDKMDARVLGTEINVSAYPGENGHVALLRGSVVITSHRLGNSVKLIPGQGATLADNGTLTVKPENMEKYLRWKEGYLYFDDTPLTDVATTLSRWYNVDIVFDNPSLRQARIHFSCDRNESLPRVIELINHFGYFQAALKGDVLHFSEEK